MIGLPGWRRRAPQPAAVEPAQPAPSSPGPAPLRLSFGQVLKQEKAARQVARWPAREPGNRLEPVCWPVIQPKFVLAGARKVFTVGSCFARNIEEQLEARGYETPTRRFAVPKSEWPSRANGILNKFTPANIWQELDWTWRALEAGGAERTAILAEPLLDLADGSCVDLELNGLLPVTRARALERRCELLELNRHAFDCDLVVLTPGLCEAWWDASRGRHIEQMPPRTAAAAEPDRFSWEMLGFEAAYSALDRSVELLTRHGRPHVKVLVTVSPVPLKSTFSGEDVILANTLAKSILRAAVGQLAARRAAVDYFPSYESVMLSRAPEVWSDDLRHVSSAFVGQIVERLIAAYFTPAASADGQP